MVILAFFFVCFDFQTNIHFEVNKTSTKFGEKIQDSRKRYSWNHLLYRSIIDLSVPIERVLKSMVQRVFGIIGCILKKYSKSKQTKYSQFVELDVRWAEWDIKLILVPRKTFSVWPLLRLILALIFFWFSSKFGISATKAGSGKSFEKEIKYVLLK